MKACLYISAFSPGGAERQIVNLAGELSGRGVSVKLLHAQKDLQNAYYLDAIRGKGVELINVLQPDFLKQGIQLSKQHVDFYANIPAPATLRLISLYLAGAFFRLKPNLVHSYLDLANCTAGCAAVMAGIPVHLASFRHVDPQTRQDSQAGLAFRLYSYLLAHARPHFEANSRAGVEHYARWLNIDPQRIGYCPNGLNPDICRVDSTQATQKLRAGLGIPLNARIVLSIARFSPNKAPTTMLEIFARTLASRPDCHYLIAGPGMTDDDEMGFLVRQRGLVDHVHLLGVRNDVATLLANADIFLLPSREEGFPNAIMEAMAAGRPVVASNVGGIPDLVRQGQDGFLHEATDAEGMAESVRTLLDNAGLRTQLGENGHHRVMEEYSLRKLGDRVLDRYQSLLGYPV